MILPPINIQECATVVITQCAIDVYPWDTPDVRPAKFQLCDWNFFLDNAIKVEGKDFIPYPQLRWL